MDGLWWKTLLNWMMWGYHYFWKHPNGVHDLVWFPLFQDAKLPAGDCDLRIYQIVSFLATAATLIWHRYTVTWIALISLTFTFSMGGGSPKWTAFMALLGVKIGHLFQGCRCVPYIFLIYIYIFAETIRHRWYLKHLNIGETRGLAWLDSGPDLQSTCPCFVMIRIPRTQSKKTLPCTVSSGRTGRYFLLAGLKGPMVWSNECPSEMVEGEGSKNEIPKRIEC